MNRIIKIVVSFVLPLFIVSCSNVTNNDRYQTGNGSNEKGSNSDSGDYYWGIDSASYTSNEMLQCVKDNFGDPDIWGRYLGTKEDVSFGIDNNEVELLHENDIKILVIYNHVNNLTGYQKGVSEAEQAIVMAKNQNIPDGVALFVDVEPSYPVDESFLTGWYNTLKESAYHPGVYGVFSPDSDVLTAFSNISFEAQENIVVWTAYPQAQITAKENAPQYEPQGPNQSSIYGWQYAIDASLCNIDTNLFEKEIDQYVW